MMNSTSYYFKPGFKISKIKSDDIRSETWKGHRSMDHEKSMNEDLVATTMKSFRKNRIETQCSPRRSKKVKITVKRSDPVTLKFMESNCKKELSRPDLPLIGSETKVGDGKKVRLLSRSNFEQDYKVLRNWKKTVPRLETKTNLNPSIQEIGVSDRKTNKSLKNLTFDMHSSSSQIPSPSRSPGSKSRLPNQAKVYKKQPMFKIKELDYRGAIDNMKKQFKPSTFQDNEDSVSST